MQRGPFRGGLLKLAQVIEQHWTAWLSEQAALTLSWHLICEEHLSWVAAAARPSLNLLLRCRHRPADEATKNPPRIY
jgi:hypothetical protein